MTKVLNPQSPNPATTIFLRQDMSTSTAPPSTTASPIPKPKPKQPVPELPAVSNSRDQSPEPQAHKKQSLCPHARLRVHLDDLSHPAISAFTQHVPLANLLEDAIRNVQHHLFTPPTSEPDFDQTPQHDSKPVSDLARPPPQRPIDPPKHAHWTPQEVRSLTLILRPMDGVAYTTGTTLDEAHKEIHLSLDYLSAILKRLQSSSTTTAKGMSTSTIAPYSAATASTGGSSPLTSSQISDFIYEVHGVLTHETVHAFQHNCHGTAPGGLIEGIADYVRKKSHLGAKHWTPWPASAETRGEKWDEGYQRTAWFLEFCEKKLGERGSIGRLNELMKGRKWEEGEVWKGVFGRAVEECWDAYVAEWEGMNRRHEREEEEDKEKGMERERK